MSAIRAEKQAAPGEGIVIANTSETILNQSQTNSLLGALRGGGGKGVNIGSINIYATSSDPGELADKVIKEIEYRLSVYSQGVGSVMV